MTPKGANLEGSDLLEVSTLESGSYVTRSITGQEIIDAAASSGGVTDVTATAPIISTGGTTPNLSMEGANGADDGFLKSTDWNTFNDKQNALTLTTTGTSGAATLVGDTLNIPQYSGGGGGGDGIHGAMIRSGGATTYIVNSLSSYTATSTTNLRLSAVPFIPIKTFTTASFYINVGTSQVAAIARILIYSELNGLPDQKLYESANLDLSSTGIKTATTSFTFTAGTTYFVCTHTQGTAGVTHIPVTSLMPISIGGISTPTTFFSSTVSWSIGSAPTTFGSVNSLNSAAILVGITSA
jgi:methylglyoxal synthase